MYKYVVFDLDGTLLDTLQDLADATNWVCIQHGWPIHSVEKYKTFVGNGAAKLVERVVPAGVVLTERLHQQLLDEFTLRYNAHKEDKTVVYPGMLELVQRLKELGIKMAVLTNKPDEAAVPMVERYYPGLLPLVQGAIPGYPTKPDPTLLQKLMKRMDAQPEHTLFVGDSNVDIQTAKNSGLDSCGVLWGFRTRKELMGEGANYLAENACQLEQIIMGAETHSGNKIFDK